jgi:succinyl-CoA synthetase alpha subunit
MCIGVGGDILPGTTLIDGLQILTEDQATEAIALVGEIGGEAEMEAADWISEYRARTKKPKSEPPTSPSFHPEYLKANAELSDRPIAAIIGGINAVPGRIMGHAGAFALPGEPSAQAKIEALQAAGCAIVNHPSRFGPVLKAMLNGSVSPGRSVGSPSLGASSQRRGIHSVVRRPASSTTIGQTWQKRSIYLTQSTALNLLRQRGLAVIDTTSSQGERRLLAVTVNRSTGSPCVIASASVDGDGKKMKKFDYDYGIGPTELDIKAITSQIGLEGVSGEAFTSSLRAIITELVTLFAEKEAYLLETQLVTSNDTNPKIAVAYAHFGFDDAAHRSGKRQADIQALRDTSVDNAAEVDAEKDGIVYIKLPDGQGEGETANIGTLVNGAGLAMNTVDAIADAGGRAANFLDTGGKATSESVKRSFQLILTDPRVKVLLAMPQTLLILSPFALVEIGDWLFFRIARSLTGQCIFVNIFGGLTLGDMIARGIILAFRDLHMTVPVVVRIRGTNEEEGQRIIAQSGLPLFAFDDFDEAAEKAIMLANLNTT